MPLILETQGMRAEFKEGNVKPDAETSDHYIILHNGEAKAVDYNQWSTRPDALSGTLTIVEGDGDPQVTFAFSDAVIQTWTGPELNPEGAGSGLDHLDLKAGQFTMVINS